MRALHWLLSSSWREEPHGTDGIIVLRRERTVGSLSLPLPRQWDCLDAEVLAGLR